ncbi:zinc finger, PHD-type containing protein [Tanacetum coccineum]
MESNVKSENVITLIQHEHPLHLVDLQPCYPDYIEFSDDEVEDKVIKWDFKSSCNQCGKDINVYHRYYVHLDCATSRNEPFMSIFLSAGTGKTIKNFKDADHPDLLKLPFPDQTYTILQHWLSKESGSTSGETSERNLNHISHQHVLSLVGSQSNDGKGATSSSVSSLSCHDPMKRIELLCNGCVRPIMDVPFYKCEEQHCDFVLHEWCTRLPAELPNHPDHPRHKLFFVSKFPGCALFLPGIINHKLDKHPMKLTYGPVENHKSEYICEVCEEELNPNVWFYHCHVCAYSLHTRCAPHSVSLALGTDADGECTICHDGMRNYLIVKCLNCKLYAMHWECCLRMFGSLSHLKDAIVGGLKIQMLYQEQLVGRKSRSLTDLIVVTFLQRLEQESTTTSDIRPTKAEYESSWWIRSQLFFRQHVPKALVVEHHTYYIAEEELRLCLEAEERMRLEHEKNIIEEQRFRVNEAKRMKLEEEKLLEISELKKKAARVYEFNSCEKHIGKVNTYKGESR